MCGPRQRTPDVLIVAASRFDEFPDLQVTDSTFRAPRKVTDGDAQTQAVPWGTGGARSTSATPTACRCRRALYKPENFDPTKKYPMMVYIYERLSQNVHNFVEPGARAHHQHRLLRAATATWC